MASSWWSSRRATALIQPGSIRSTVRHRASGLAEEVEPGRVDGAAERQVCPEPSRVLERGQVVDGDRKQDLPVAAGDEIHDEAHCLSA
jgi:hypothetical protein